MHWRETLGMTPEPEMDDPMPLIPSLSDWGPLTENRLYRIMVRAYSDVATKLEDEDAELNATVVSRLRQATPHWMRHTALTHQAQQGVELRFLAKTARHSRWETTSRYIHVEDDEWHAQAERHAM